MTLRKGALQLEEFHELMELVDRLDNPLEKMGLFDKEYMTGTLATFERRVNTTDEMYSVARGGDRQVAGDDHAVDAHIETPFFGIDKTIKAHELIDMREFGTEAEKKTARRTLENIVRRFQRDHAKTYRKAMYTALVSGKTYAKDKAGVDIPNLTRTFQSMFGIDNAKMYKGQANGAATLDLTAAKGIKTEFETFRKHVIDNAGDEGDNYEIIVMMGTGAFSALEDSTEYADAVANTRNQDLILNRLGGLSNTRVLNYKGVTFVEDITGEIGNDKGVAFPMGIVDMFQLKVAPADTIAASGSDTPAEDNYLFVEEQPRKITAQSDLSIVCANTRPELVAQYTFTI